jgi:rubrerythrin
MKLPCYRIAVTSTTMQSRRTLSVLAAQLMTFVSSMEIIAKNNFNYRRNRIMLLCQPCRLLKKLEDVTMSLKGSKTEQNLKDAFAGESQANRRYLYFAQKADIEGYNDVAAVFRSTAEGETGHAHGHLEYLEESGDPATGLPIGSTADNLRAAVAGETHEYTDMYPGMASAARDEGFDEIADWFETLGKAERSHANRFQKALDELD